MIEDEVVKSKGLTLMDVEATRRLRGRLRMPEAQGKAERLMDIVGTISHGRGATLGARQLWARMSGTMRRLRHSLHALLEQVGHTPRACWGSALQEMMPSGHPRPTALFLMLNCPPPHPRHTPGGAGRAQLHSVHHQRPCHGGGLLPRHHGAADARAPARAGHRDAVRAAGQARGGLGPLLPHVALPPCMPAR